MKKIILSTVIVAAIVLVGRFAPLVEASYTVEVRETETYYEDIPLQYRNLDSFSRFVEPELADHAPLSPLGDLEEWAAEYNYEIELSGEHTPIPEYWGLYVVIQNLDDRPGTLEVSYTLATANKEAAERQKNLIQRTPAEYEELEREYYVGIVELQLEPGQIGVFICPPDGIHIDADRVPFDHNHEITPDTDVVERERLVTRFDTHYERVPLFEYLRSRL